MQLFDWIVLIVTLLFIVIYGVWKTKGSKNVTEYILGSNETPWFTVGVSIIAIVAFYAVMLIQKRIKSVEY